MRSPARRREAITAIRQADIVADRALVRELWHAYLTWALGELDRHYGIAAALMERVGTMERFLDHIMDELPSYSPPVGRLLLAVDAGTVVGSGCLCPIDERTAVVHRLYVQPSQRREGIGRSLLEGLLDGARASGYERVVLDSPRFMHAAHALYRSAGFVEIEPYRRSGIPRAFWRYWIFMERTLVRT